MEKTLDINEGNAFVVAAKKAKEDGKDSFELNGKTYKVTVKSTKKEEPKENIGATNMAIGFKMNEEKKRIISLIEQTSGKNNLQPQNQNNGGSDEMVLEDHVYCPIHTFMMSVTQKSMNKDDISFVIKGDSNMGDLKIADMTVNDDYTEEQIQQARQLVENALQTISFPSGASFSLSNPTEGEIEH